MRNKLLPLCLLLAACAGTSNTTPEASAKKGAEAAAPAERGWKDKLGITYVARSLACTYKLLAFFTDSAAARPISRASGTDTIFSCVGDKTVVR